MKTYIQIVLFTLFLSLVSQDSYSFEFRSSRFDIETEITLESFSKVEVYGNVDVYISEASEQKVKVVGNENIINELNFLTKNGVLYFSHGSSFDLKNRIVVYIQIPKIEGLKAGGSTDIIGEGLLSIKQGVFYVSGNSSILVELDSDSIDAHALGKGKLGLAGKVNNMTLAVEESATADAVNLFAENVTITTSSSEDIYIDVTNKLEVQIANNGNVVCKSMPTNKLLNRTGKGELLIN
tara:strand:+ start:840 stop:1553 length:714 start_codon:yes stop_codon:yes gene_type:complete